MTARLRPLNARCSPTRVRPLPYRAPLPIFTPARAEGDASMKLAIIGAGAVGQACLLATVLRGPASEIVVVDRTRERADGMVTDIQYGAALSPSVTLRAGDYGEVRDAGLVMITA